MVTINITINQTYSTSETHAICDGGSYPLPWGGTATSAGPYPHTYSSQAGCDSLVTINITVNQTYSTSETHAICQGGSYPLPWGGTATSAGPYPHTYSSQAGCDSLVMINITVNQTYSTSETHAICQGGSYPLPWGGTATSAGPYPHTYSSQAGCDSLVTINIDVNQTYSTSETHAICDGGSYPLPWGGTATSAGPYPHTYSSQAGCDSLVTINITINQTYSTSETHAICDGGSYPLPWGGTATSAGPYPHTYSSQAGCDSLVTINITVNQTYSTSESHAICQGGSYSLPWGGTATSAGPYPHTYSSQAGCDSLVTINITVNQTYSTSETHAICDGGSYPLPWGETATSAGPYPHTYSSQAGCDSLVTINITVNQTYSTSESHAICQGGSYSLPWGGTATSAGPYPHTYSSQAGCDSLVTINITVNAAYHTSSTASFCQGGSYTLPWGQVVTSGGTYSHNYSTALHCDSLVDVIVSSKTVPSCTISATGCGNNNSICQGQTAQLCAPAGSGYTYNWSNGLHTQCINVTTAGTYTVTVSNSTGCSSTCSKTISVGQAPSCTITATGCGSNNTICQGRSVQLCGPSGNGYSYSWSNGLHSQCISVTAAGTYTLTVTNSSGCSSTCTKTIYVSSIPSCNITTTGCGSNNTICQGQTVQLCAPSGQGYSYLWSNGLRTQCISVTSAGTYSVTVTNAGGCSSTCSKTIYVSAGPSCNISVTGCGSNNSICQGQSATLCAPAGSGYSYTWNNGTHGRCLTVNTGGTYSVTVTNSAGCSSTCSKVIIVNPRPNSTITGPASLCAGQSSTLCVAGGTGYSYTWNNGTHNRCLNINGPGTYSVTVTNSSGCSSTSSICIAAGSRPSSTITGNRCYNSGQSTTLCAPLGTNYSYTWSNGSHNRCISVNCSGSYSVTVTNGCGSSTSCVQVTRCRSNCRMILNPKDRTLTAEVDGGIAPYSFVWNNDPSQTSSEVDVTSPGVYEVEITDAEGTIIRETYKVTLPALVVTAYPNPLSSTTTIEFRNNFDSENGRIEIYSLDGRKVAVLFDGTMEKDKTYLVKWDAKENADGVYLFKIICGDAIETGRLTLIRE
ncbi:MAG: T9SS type A sorting domain-containing protein [Bacteroidetes bacterium]|nr:T9SS type A sorting domain-containing protein [Bacteroidota bacterium]